MHLHVHLPVIRRLAREHAAVNARAEFHAEFSLRQNRITRNGYFPRFDQPRSSEWLRVVTLRRAHLFVGKSWPRKGFRSPGAASPASGDFAPESPRPPPACPT